jgi:hypothetical protein
MSNGSPYARLLLRDERTPRLHRLWALNDQIRRCYEAELYDASLAMAFIRLDMWAFLLRPPSFRIHTRGSFIWFVERYLATDHDQSYHYKGVDVYTARCAMLHTFGSLTEQHGNDPSIVIWRYHLGQHHSFAPGLHRIAYVSVHRFMTDADRAMKRCLDTLTDDPEASALAMQRLPSVFFHGGILPSRDSDAMATLEAATDAEIAEFEKHPDRPIPRFAGRSE